MSRKGKERHQVVITQNEIVKEEVTQPPTQEQRAFFRQFFEQHYAPLEVQGNKQQEHEDFESISEESSSASEWNGLDESEETPGVVVIDHTNVPQNHDQTSVQDSYKAYMSALPPKTVNEIPKFAKTKARIEPGEDDSSEAANLENDLALQRLLKESHLLQTNNSSVPVGSQRHHAIDMRLRALGSKDSILEQTKMPLSHRTGIKAKAAAVESRRRLDAKENGIILEKPASRSKSKSKSARRDRGVGKPAVGRFSGGTLKLSQKDLQAIQGPRTAAKRKRGR